MLQSEFGIVICTQRELSAAFICSSYFVRVKQKETGSKWSAVKDKEPTSWRWDKQELERQVKDWKKKYDDLVQSSADAKKDKDKVALKPAKFGSASTAVIIHLFVKILHFISLIV